MLPFLRVSSRGPNFFRYCVCPMKANSSKSIGFKNFLSHWNLLLKTNRTISKTWKSDQCNLFKTYSILFYNLSESKTSRSFFGVILCLILCFSIICVKWSVSCGDLDKISTFTHNGPWLDAQRGAWVWFYSPEKNVSTRYRGPKNVDLPFRSKLFQRQHVFHLTMGSLQLSKRIEIHLYLYRHLPLRAIQRRNASIWSFHQRIDHHRLIYRLYRHRG